MTTRCFPCEDGGQGNVILNRKAVKDPNQKWHKGSYAAVWIWILRRIAPQNDVNVGALFGGGIYGLFVEIATSRRSRRLGAPRYDFCHRTQWPGHPELQGGE